MQLLRAPHIHAEHLPSQAQLQVGLCTIAKRVQNLAAAVIVTESCKLSHSIKHSMTDTR